MPAHVKPWRIDPESEAENLLKLYGGDSGLSKCLDVIRHQFDVIQARSQLLLTLATLALTITGFSGPTIARTNDFARATMAIGIVFVLMAIVLLLRGGLRIQWITQFHHPNPKDLLIEIMRYRDSKTQLYRTELTLLVIGLASYVTSVVTYLVYWQ